MKKKKNLFNLLFLAAVFAFTAWCVLKDQDRSDLVAALGRVKKGYLAGGVLLVIVFVCSESIIIRYLLGRLGKAVTLLRCIRYSFIGFFFSCITPSASGGQPAQVYYMKRDGIDISESALVLLIITIAYKFILVFIGTLLFLFGGGSFWPMVKEIRFIFFLGMALNVVCITAMFLLVFDAGFAKKAVMWLLSAAEKVRILKPSEERRRKLSESMDQYHAAAAFLKGKPGVILNVFLITLFQRVCLFFVTYLVYLAFGGKGFGAVLVTSLTAAISISVDMLPLPGGMGASEGIFLKIFRPVFGRTDTLPAMLVSRGVSYYALLFISAGVTCFAQFVSGKKRIKLKAINLKGNGSNEITLEKISSNVDRSKENSKKGIGLKENITKEISLKGTDLKKNISKGISSKGPV